MNKKVLDQIVRDYAERDECEQCVCCHYENGGMTCPCTEYDGYEFYPRSHEECCEQIMKEVQNDN